MKGWEQDEGEEQKHTKVGERKRDDRGCDMAKIKEGNELEKERSRLFSLGARKCERK